MQPARLTQTTLDPVPPHVVAIVDEVDKVESEACLSAQEIALLCDVIANVGSVAKGREAWMNQTGRGVGVQAVQVLAVPEEAQDVLRPRDQRSKAVHDSNGNRGLAVSSDVPSSKGPSRELSACCRNRGRNGETLSTQGCG